MAVATEITEYTEKIIMFVLREIGARVGSRWGLEKVVGVLLALCDLCGKDLDYYLCAST